MLNNKMIAAALVMAFGFAPCLPIWTGIFSLSHARAEESIATRIQAKISQVGAIATKLHESGADVSSIQQAMQHVDALLRSGESEDAEKALDSLLTKLNGSAIGGEPKGATEGISKMTRRRLVHDLSSAFLVFIDKIQSDMEAGLSNAQ